MDGNTVLTMHNEPKGHSQLLLWDLPGSYSADPQPAAQECRKLDCRQNSKIHEMPVSAYAVGGNGEAVVGTVDGFVKRLDLRCMIEIDSARGSELRVSHVCYLEEKDDQILAIAADGNYSVLRLNGEHNTVASTSVTLLPKDSGKRGYDLVSQKSTIWRRACLIGVLAGLLLVAVAVLYIIFA